jgi:hypothetical protein
VARTERVTDVAPEGKVLEYGNGTEFATPVEPGLSLQEDRMVITAAHLSPLLSIIFGILILIVPRFLNYLVAVYLILAGLLGLGILR